MIKQLCVLFILLSSLSSQAQITISGKILDEQQKPISGVSVSYKKVGAVAILGFGRTDNEGKFKLDIKIKDADSLQIDFNHLSYAKKSVTVVNSTASYAYMLQKETREIQEVQVGKLPIYRRKDTINYNVDIFTSPRDRVIGDIIKKLPGIEMRGEEIFYQGEPLQKYMVNNLDLMEGRYGMINKNLPADAVKKLQIIENDQPIKILDSLVFSNRASLNLVLKKFTTTGTGKVGAGASPGLWELNLTPMTFGKTFQMLNSFQTNNVGEDVSKDLRSFYTGGGYIQPHKNVQDGPTYIHLRNVSSPGFDENKWLDNKIFLFSSNMLQKLNNDLEVKGNVSYYDDTRKRQGFTATQYYTADEIIYNSEDIDNHYRTNVLDAGFLLEKNEKQIYLRNNFRYHKRWSADRGNLFLNEADLLEQRTNYTDEALLNNLSVARFIGKQLVNISSSLEWHHTPQRLRVSPGQFEDIIHNSIPYDEMSQSVQYGSLKWENNLGFTRKIKRWTFSPNVAVNYNRNTLNSRISLQEGQSIISLEEGYWNDMRNTQLNTAVGLRVGWENYKWKIHLNTPYNLHYFNVIQQEEQTLDNVLKNTFNPSMGMTYIINSRNELSTSASVGRNYGGLNNFYNGFIISQYRSMQRYDARLLQTDSRNARISYYYKNTLKANFANLSYSYSDSDRDYIFTTQLDSLGRATTSIANHSSTSDNHRVSGGLSRYFSAFKTVVKLNGNIGWSRSDYLLNNIMAVQYGKQRSATFEIINSLSEVISGDYKMTMGQNINKLAAGRQYRNTYNNHYLNIILYFDKQNMLYVGNSLYRNNIEGQKDQFFTDLTYRYHVNKWKTDIEFTAQNLFNNHQYIQQISNDIEFIQSYFELRPRQFLISTQFKF